MSRVGYAVGELVTLLRRVQVLFSPSVGRTRVVDEMQTLMVQLLALRDAYRAVSAGDMPNDLLLLTRRVSEYMDRRTRGMEASQRFSLKLTEWLHRATLGPRDLEAECVPQLSVHIDTAHQLVWYSPTVVDNCFTPVGQKQRVAYVEDPIWLSVICRCCG